MTATARTQFTATCSRCGAAWTDRALSSIAQHQCPVPPEIDWFRYSTSALEQIVDHLALVIEGRKQAGA